MSDTIESAAEAEASGREEADSAWHARAVDEVLERLEVELDTGLDVAEADRRLERHGPNELVRQEGPGPWWILWTQFTEPLVVVLIAATVVSATLWWLEGQAREPVPYDAIVILAIVLLNAVIGFVQEYRAERALESLQEMTAPEARVRRGGEEREIDARELVPGDVLLLESGDRVPADARLARQSNLQIDEAPLTGESVAVAKDTEPLEAGLEPADRTNMAFMGTAVTYGRGEGVVVATGMDTEMGSIAELLGMAREERTPLQEELDRVGRQLGMLVLAISVIVAATGAIREGSFTVDVLLDMFLFGVALAVAAIPEGLPAIVTVVLAIGVRRMADRDAVVRRLPAVETLGSATVICSDKTGTLTRNEMTVRRIVLGVDRELELEGEGYVPEGGFRDPDGGAVDPDGVEGLVRSLEIGALVNDADLVEEEGRWRIDGDPTEGALVVAARKAGIDEGELREERPRLDEIPFSSERKRMTTIHEIDGETVACVKGAPEVVLDLATRVRVDGELVELDESARETIRERDEAYAEEALRTLAIASRKVGDENASDPDAIERELVWEGMVGMIDPPRAGARESVERARKAGIRTILVTGDHVRTGHAVAVEVGIVGEDEPAIGGSELEETSDEELAEKVREVSVFGRVRPEDKLRIVRALSSHGEIVAMTGDGVNDAPALKEADIGVAMGITGTDVSKEASEMVLADDDYSTIVEAIAEGRKIFGNIRKFVRYLLTSNAGEVLTIFLAVVLAGWLGFGGGEGGGFFLPLLAVQILWINLVTDGAPALALGLDPGEPGMMDRPPRDPDRPIIDRPMWVTIGLTGTVMMFGTLFVLDAYMPGGLVGFRVPDVGGAETLLRARTMAFTTLVLFQLFNVFNCLDPVRSVFHRETFRNRWLLAAVAFSVALHAVVVYWEPLQRGFGTVALEAADWTLATGVAATVVLASEVWKWNRPPSAGE